MIAASVDAVNTASVAISRRLEFRLVETRTGAFGDLLVMELVSDLHFSRA